MEIIIFCAVNAVDLKSYSKLGASAETAINSYSQVVLLVMARFEILAGLLSGLFSLRNRGQSGEGFFKKYFITRSW